MRTERLELRPLREEDLDALVELDGFEEVRETIDPFAEHIPLDATERREYERRFEGNAGFLGAVERATGRLLGWFQVEPALDGSGDIELGYRLRPDAWGQGFATEGAAALLADALARSEVTRVYAHALDRNPASRRCGSWRRSGALRRPLGVQGPAGRGVGGGAAALSPRQRPRAAPPSGSDRCGYAALPGRSAR